MKTEWDYTHLAKAYLKRPDYSIQAIDEMFKKTGIVAGNNACDIGAGVGHLTIELAERELNVVAVEPNNEMMKLGKKRTVKYKNINWVEGTGENTKQADASFDIVTFGSSFNVTNRSEALKETKRILRDGGWFAAMWNHRDLDDPVQKGIENAIKSKISSYNYGTRREDQKSIIESSGLFRKVYKVEGCVEHSQSMTDIIEAWRSHATLYRQAGNRFDSIIEDIKAILLKCNGTAITVPYTTRIWIAQLS